MIGMTCQVIKVGCVCTAYYFPRRVVGAFVSKLIHESQSLGRCLTLLVKPCQKHLVLESKQLCCSLYYGHGS